ncbi:MAG: hypothetical protein JXR40_01895 [Pontiellaceae bacterium]|nr:hypothetical protein [Pontiellaceae bacterium]
MAQRCRHAVIEFKNLLDVKTPEFENDAPVINFSIAESIDSTDKLDELYFKETSLARKLALESLARGHLFIETRDEAGNILSSGEYGIEPDNHSAATESAAQTPGSNYIIKVPVRPGIHSVTLKP